MMVPRNLAIGLAAVALAACGESATQPDQVPKPDRVPLEAASELILCGSTLVLESQADIDAFNCTHVTGDLTINFPIDSVTNLDGLSELQSVGGHFTVTNVHGLRNLDGLSSLTSVGGILHIVQNFLLTNIDGLSALRSIGGLDLFANHALPNVDGLSGLTSVDGILSIQLNDALEDVDGLSALTSVGSLRIFRNAVLSKCACGLYRLVQGGGAEGVTIEDNAPGCNSEADISATACAACTSELLLGTITAAQNGGSLKASHARALLNKLQSAEEKAAKAKFADAAIDMDAFIVQVRELEAKKQISSDTAATLIKSAEALRDIWRPTRSKMQARAG